MAPAQSLSDTDPATKAHSTTKAVPSKDNKIILKNSGGRPLRRMSNFEDTISEMEALLSEHTKIPESTQISEVDIIGCASTSDIRLTEGEYPDTTEHSSSFGDTISGAENCSGLSDAEVESRFCGDTNFASAFVAFNSVFPMRKKKLTTHWRNFIRPLMWRCKWTELRMKEIESQASKYATELAAYDQRIPSESDKFTLESNGSRSLPFSGQHCRKKAMKRRKRKRVEDTTDVTSYMLRHNLFSYLENKRSDPDGACVADDFGNSVITDQNANGNDKFRFSDDPLFTEFRDGDNSLEPILWKIEVIHSRVNKLRTQLEMVMSKNAGKFSSSENLSLLAPCDPQTSSAHSPTISAGNGDAISVGAEYEVGDPFMHEGAVSNYVEAIHVPDIIESTVGLLSAADVTLHQPEIGDSCEDMVDDLLVHNQAAEEEVHTFENVSNQLIDRQPMPETGEQEESTKPPMSSAKPDVLPEGILPQQQSTLKSCLASEVHFPKNKRKRAERRAASGGWNRRHAGEPDSY